MKCFLKIIVNIILIIIIYLAFKYVSIAVVRIREANNDFETLIYLTNEVFKQKDYKAAYKYYKVPKPVISINNEKKPIIIFGCSYAFGLFLEDEDKFSYKLYEATGRSVYNRAICSQGLQYMLYQLEDENTYKELPEPEYIIYVYMGDHIRRLFQECCIYNKSAFYKVDKNDLKLIKNPIYYTYPLILFRKIKGFDDSPSEKKYNFLRMHFIKAKQLSDKYWHNAKWIILVYDDSDKKIFEGYEKYGFKVVYATDFVPDDFLTNLKYKVSATDLHPSKEAWQVLTPEFAKRYIK